MKEEFLPLSSDFEQSEEIAIVSLRTGDRLQKWSEVYLYIQRMTFLWKQQRNVPSE
jgi:hypothetical protein